MKLMKYIVGSLIVMSTLHAGANDFVGKYICDKGRYVKTVVLNSDGSGAWIYNNAKSSKYDYDEKISWTHNKGGNYVVIELLTQDADGRIQKKGKSFTLLPEGNGLRPKNSKEVFIEN